VCGVIDDNKILFIYNVFSVLDVVCVDNGFKEIDNDLINTFEIVDNKTTVDVHLEQ